MEQVKDKFKIIHLLDFYLVLVIIFSLSNILRKISKSRQKICRETPRNDIRIRAGNAGLTIGEVNRRVDELYVLVGDFVRQVNEGFTAIGDSINQLDEAMLRLSNNQIDVEELEHHDINEVD